MRVERGHLVLEDGIGPRHKRRFPRVGHGIRRLVLIGSDGTVSLAALRWLADQDVAFVMLERDGYVLTTTGPIRPSDARLRRAQSLAHQSGIALDVARELIKRKLTGQEQLVRDCLRNPSIATQIAEARAALKSVGTIALIRQFEAQAAHSYWSGLAYGSCHFSGAGRSSRTGSLADIRDSQVSADRIAPIGGQSS